MATHRDAEVVLALYDLRREPVMRKARHFMALQFWPKSGSDIVELMMDFKREENAYFRQVTSFWDMAASLVLRGALDPLLFADWSHEMFFIFGKLDPYAQEVRRLTESPKWLHNVFGLIESNAELSAEFEIVKKRVTRLSENFARLEL